MICYVKGLVRFLLFVLLGKFVRYQAYGIDPAETGGWAGWFELPVIGVLAFVKDTGKRKFAFSLLLALILVVSISTPALAQEVTETATGEVTEVVIEAPLEVTEEAPPEVDPIEVINNQQETIINLVNLIYNTIIIFAGAGTIIGGLILFLTNRQAKNTTEKLYLSTPKETQDVIREATLKVTQIAERTIEVAERLIQFAKDVTDGKLEPEDGTAQSTKKRLPPSQY